MRKVRIFSVVVFTSVFAAACNDAHKQKAEDLKHQVREFSKSAIDAAPKVDIGLSVEELKKLYQFEYNVFSYPLTTSPVDLSKELTNLGQQRWDCFHIERTQPVDASGGAILMYCKRHPESVLQYIPRGLVGGMWGLVN